MIKQVQEILDLALIIEKKSKDQDFSKLDIEALAKLLNKLNSSNNPEIKKLAQIADHLHTKMTLHHFTNYIIPLERFLDRALKDDDFLTSTLDEPDKQIRRRPIYFILDNIRSAFNVGSIFRLADCVGVSVIYLCGYTPGPENKALEKTSLSTVDYLAYKHYKKSDEAIKLIQDQNIPIIALETSKNTKSIFETPLQGPIAFLVGNERFGLDRRILSLAKEVRHIPVYGMKNSLNVVNSLSIAAYEWSRQNQ